jgi:putative transport protein
MPDSYFRSSYNGTMVSTRGAIPSTAIDLLTLSIGMVRGFLIGAIQFSAFGAKVGIGNAGGLLVSGMIVSSVASRLRFFGNTPNAARNVPEDLGLIIFVSIVGINAGNSLLTQLALKIFRPLPPVIVWSRLPRLQDEPRAAPMGGVAGARNHSGPSREAVVEIQSNVLWIGFPVAYAVSGVLDFDVCHPTAVHPLSYPIALPPMPGFTTGVDSSQGEDR